MFTFLKYSFSFLILFIFTACDKGYEVRFTNYYVEPVDSVIIGANALVFRNVELQQTTEYKPLSKGKYNVQIVSKTKKKITGNIEIPSSGTGKYTLQVDGIKQISLLQD